MMKFKRIIALLLCVAMVAALAACGDKTTNTPTPTQSAGGPTPTTGAGTQKRTKDILIGTWWVQHYDSADTDVSDSPDWDVAQETEKDDDKKKAEKAANRQHMIDRFNHVKTIEQRYGVKYFWQNLTYSGVQESINTSIMAGTPDCDIYLVDAGMAIPAQMSGLCVDLRTILPKDHDIFTTQTVAKFLDLGDGKACIIQRQGGMNNNNALGFNKQLLDSYGLEDPRVLWDKGEWTWDKFEEYCKILTEDTDGDGNIDQYGFCAWDSDQFEQFMLSNGANIAQGTTQQLTSPKMTEVLQFLHDLHVKDKVCYPVTSDMDANAVRTMYRNGNIGFFWMNVWVQVGTNDGDDYDWNNNGKNPQLDFDVIYCHWPVGPSGNQDTDPQLNNVGGELYIIPAGVEDPLTVFNVLYEGWNWYGWSKDNTEAQNEEALAKRDDPASLNWWIDGSGRSEETRMSNFKIQKEILSKTTVDLWNSMSVSFNLWELLDGTVDPAQWQETYKQNFQDALDQYFGK
jgi:ABC-type glycerol-3-phosphate transport system substrate-binding protein